MKFYNLIIYLLASLIISSCSKEEVSPTESIIEFSNIEIGNYWIYEWFEIEPDGTESSYNRIDTVFIKGDTVINDKKFYIKSGTFLENEQTIILFDSVNSLYSYPTRELLFTLDETKQTTVNFGLQESPIAIGSYSLSSNVTSIIVPAGEFECLNFQGIIEPLEQDYKYGTRINSNLYSKNVGLVKMTTQFYSSPNDLEMRLVKFGGN